MQALQDSLRTLSETRAFFVKLTQNFKTRFFFCLAALDVCELFLCAGDQLLMLSCLLFASLNSGSTMIDFALKILGRRACGGRLLLEPGAGGFYVGNGGIQTAAILLCRFAADFESGNF